MIFEKKFCTIIVLCYCGHCSYIHQMSKAAIIAAMFFFIELAKWGNSIGGGESETNN